MILPARIWGLSGYVQPQMRVDIYKFVRLRAVHLPVSVAHRIASHKENVCDSFKGSLLKSELSFFFVLVSFLRELSPPPPFLTLVTLVTLGLLDT